MKDYVNFATIIKIKKGGSSWHLVWDASSNKENLKKLFSLEKELIQEQENVAVFLNGIFIPAEDYDQTFFRCGDGVVILPTTKNKRWVKFLI